MAPEPSRRAERLYKVTRVVEKGGTQPGFGITMANLLLNVAGVTDAVTLVGAILHDTVECHVVKLLSN